MNTETIPELISFKICPFAQRSAIALLEKNVNYKTTYVDLKNRPDWFAEVSPLEVPVLGVADAVVFESAVIAEYLDERYPPRLHPQDLLTKAQHRPWTEFASDITMNLFKMLYAKTEDEFNELKETLVEQLKRVEKIIDTTGPYFAGKNLSLVDTAYAPVFVRTAIKDHCTTQYTKLYLTDTVIML